MTTTTPMPNWLRATLIDKGILTDTGLTRTARIHTHRPCHMPTLAAIDDHGLDTWCDLAELTTTGELHALLTGRPTWDLHATRTLCARSTPRRIAYWPAGTPDHPVFAEHRCHHPIPNTWTVPPTPQPATPPTTKDDECPF